MSTNCIPGFLLSILSILILWGRFRWYLHFIKVKCLRKLITGQNKTRIQEAWAHSCVLNTASLLFLTRLPQPSLLSFSLPQVSSNPFPMPLGTFWPQSWLCWLHSLYFSCNILTKWLFFLALVSTVILVKYSTLQCFKKCLHSHHVNFSIHKTGLEEYLSPVDVMRIKRWNILTFKTVTGTIRVLIIFVFCLLK